MCLFVWENLNIYKKLGGGGGGGVGLSKRHAIETKEVNRRNGRKENTGWIATGGPTQQLSQIQFSSNSKYEPDPSSAPSPLCKRFRGSFMRLTVTERDCFNGAFHAGRF